MTRSVSPRTYPLGLGTLAVGTSGYAITGLLPALTTELHASPALAGQLLTAFALTCALTGPPLAHATRGWDRRRLLVAALTVTAVGNALAALAPTLHLLLAARVVTGVGAAIYTATAAVAAARLNPPDQHARAVSVVFAGLTTALLLGVPASTALAAYLAPPAAFWCVASLCVLAAVGIAVAEPPLPTPTTQSRPDSQGVDRRIVVVLAVTLLTCLSTFTVYTYAAIILDTTETRGTSGVLLACYGVGAVIGNSLGGRSCDRHGPQRTLLGAAAVSAVLLLGLPVIATNAPGAAVVLTVWGAAIWATHPALSAWTLRLAPTKATLALTMVGSMVYLGMGLGALCGGLILTGTRPALLAPIAAIGPTLAVALLAITRPARPATDAATPAEPAGGQTVATQTGGQS
jgi:predicted MFS family arabinose efflux permease